MAALSSTLAPRQFAPVARTGAAARSGLGLTPNGCSPWKWVKCGLVIAGCIATTPIGGPAGVAACVAAGAADCLECL